MDKIKEYSLSFLNEYNQSWVDKDLEKLKEFYDVDGNKLIYYDNHKNNDTYTVQDHLALVSNFLLNGKKTESGQVEELLIEDFNVFSTNDSACLCFIAKYKSFPRPYVRTTMYLQKINDSWKALHVHCSFEPEK